jgi:hypothetical protein
MLLAGNCFLRGSLLVVEILGGASKLLMFIGWNGYCCFLTKVQEAVYMKLLTGKIVLGATLAISLGAFTYPAGASVPPIRPAKYVGTKVVGIQVAQVERDVDEKGYEVKSEAKGAEHAVRAAHRRHERNEYRHRTIAGKVDSKVDEVKNETTGAGHAIERAHDQHEALEHSEGRD